MSNEVRRQTIIVAAFVLVALAAVSPLLLWRHAHEVQSQNTDRLPINDTRPIGLPK